jgi:hypothetical protein
MYVIEQYQSERNNPEYEKEHGNNSFQSRT